MNDDARIIDVILLAIRRVIRRRRASSRLESFVLAELTSAVTSGDSFSSTNVEALANHVARRLCRAIQSGALTELAASATIHAANTRNNMAAD